MFNKKKKEKEDSIFIQETKRDIATFKRLHGKDRLQFVFDYYKWKILGALTILICILVALNLLYKGQKPYRLRVCAVLNTDDNCSSWFKDFYEDLSSDGNTTDMDLNQDQPFDYDNSYYYMFELEVMTQVSSRRIDVAICGPDMYSYLLSINACEDLTEVLDEETVAKLEKSGQLIKDDAGVTINDDGSEDRSNAVEGYHSVDISETDFGHTYNDGNEDDAPLYAVIISNTAHMDDSVKLINALIQ